jgi:hypothetical protein
MYPHLKIRCQDWRPVTQMIALEAFCFACAAALLNQFWKAEMYFAFNG